MKDLSRVIILIPTYNEKENIVSLAEAIFGLYPEISLLVLDDNSPDGTGQAVKNLQKSFSNLYLQERTGQRGFGRSYLAGFKKVLAKDYYQAVVMMDADFSHDPQAIETMLTKLTDGEVVNGSRYVLGGGVKNWRWSRRFLSRFANFYVRSILGLPVKDLTTGFLCLRRSALEKINLGEMASDGYAFLVELKYRLWKSGCRFKEHPITYTERREGQSKMSSRVIWESIWLPWKLRFRTSGFSRFLR